MPGGGEVRVEVFGNERDVTGELLRGRVVIERRADVRGLADVPIVIAEIEGSEPGAVVAELFRIARDNAAIARRVLRHRAD